MKLKSQIVKLVFLVVIAGLFLVWAGFFIYKSSFVGIDGDRHFCLFDDAMISMRYAWNLSHGHGLVWNAGERVEGFTNMLMTLFMAVCTFVFSKDGAVLAVQIAGLFFLLAGAFFTMKIGETIARARGLKSSLALSLLIFSGGLLYYPLVFWSLMGMETGLLSMLILAAVWVVMRIGGQPGRSWILPVLLGLAFWTRPDAAVPAGLIMCYRLYTMIRVPGGPRRFVLEAGVLALFVVALSVFRLAYYGSFVPNTYVLKMTGLSLSYRIENGYVFLKPFLISIAIPVCVALVGVVMHCDKRVALVAGLILTSIGYQIYVGGDPWTYWRMNAPFIPLLFMLCTIELKTLIHRRINITRIGGFKGGIPVAIREVILCTGLLFVNAKVLNERFLREVFFENPLYTVPTNRANVNVTLALSELTGPNATVGLTWAGAIPYFSERRGVDFLGKSDKYIARLAPDTQGGTAWNGMKSVPGHNKYDLEYSIIEKQPTFVQTTKWGRQNVQKFVSKEYKWVRYKGVRLWLKRNSPHVRWDKI